MKYYAKKLTKEQQEQIDKNGGKESIESLRSRLIRFESGKPVPGKFNRTPEEEQNKGWDLGREARRLFTTHIPLLLQGYKPDEWNHQTALQSQLIEQLKADQIEEVEISVADFTKVLTPKTKPVNATSVNVMDATLKEKTEKDQMLPGTKVRMESTQTKSSTQNASSSSASSSASSSSSVSSTSCTSSTSSASSSSASGVSSSSSSVLSFSAAGIICSTAAANNLPPSASTSSLVSDTNASVPISISKTSPTS